MYQCNKGVAVEKNTIGEALRIYKAQISHRVAISNSDVCRLFLLAELQAPDSVALRKFGPPLSTTEWQRAKKLAAKTVSTEASAALWKDIFSVMRNISMQNPNISDDVDFAGFKDFCLLKEHLHGSLQELSSPSTWTMLYILSSHVDALELWRSVVGRTPDVFMKAFQVYVHTHADCEVPTTVKAAIGDTL
jgi:hypothetical protein